MDVSHAGRRPTQAHVHEGGAWGWLAGWLGMGWWDPGWAVVGV